MNRQTTRSRGRPPMNGSTTRTQTRQINSTQQNQSITSYFSKPQEEMRAQSKAVAQAKSQGLLKNDQKSTVDSKSVPNSKRFPPKCIKNSQTVGELGANRNTRQGNQEEFELISNSEKENLQQLNRASQMELRGSAIKKKEAMHFTESLDEHPSIREDHQQDLKIQEDKTKVAENDEDDLDEEQLNTQQNNGGQNESNHNSSPMTLRHKKKRDYKQMQEGDENYQKTIEDERKEIQFNKGEQRYKSSQKFNEKFYASDSDQVPLQGRCNDEEQIKLFGADILEQCSEEALKKFEEDKESLYKYPGKVEEQDEDDDERSNRKRLRKLSARKSSQLQDGKNGDVDNTANDQKVCKKQQETVTAVSDAVFIDNLPKDVSSIRHMINRVNLNIRELEQQFFEEENSDVERNLKDEQEVITVEKHNVRLDHFKERSYIQQFWSIPLSDSVIEFDWKDLSKQQRNNGGRLFDVITCDPPWTLSNANPTRGVAIAYNTLSDKQILDIPFDQIQDNGFLFIWVINAKYRLAIQLMDKYKYTLVDEVTWVKQTINGKIAKGHGYYLQHAKETCLIGAKGNVLSKDWKSTSDMTDLIFSQRRGQSQKPEEIYEIAESMIPNGYYLEIFGRRNNLHNGWVTIGNEL